MPTLTNHGPSPFAQFVGEPMMEGHSRVKTVLIVDDHAILRVGMRSMLEAEPHAPAVLEAGTLHDALELCERRADIDLVLLDLNMPDCRGLQGLRRFTDSHPTLRVAVLSGTQDDLVIGQVRALGAVAYLTKGQAPDQLVRLVGELLDGGVPMLPHFPKSAGYDRVAELGTRHLEILDLVLFGCSNQEISNATGLSLGTIKNYVSTILLSLDVKSRSHLISLFR